MAKLVVKHLKQLANRIILAECVVLFIGALLFGLLTGGRSALAALTGGLIYVLPSYFYSAYLFSNMSARAIVRIMCVFYIGEVVKLVVSIVLFIVLLKLFMLPLLPYFVGYLIAALTFCVASMVLMSKRMVSSSL